MSDTSTESTYSPTDAPAAGMIRNPRLATVSVVATSAMMGMVPIWAREMTEAGLAAVSVSFYRNLLGTVLLFGFLRFDERRRKATLWGLAAGMAMGIGWTAYVRAVEVIPVSTAGVVYMSYPLFTIGLAWLIFRQPPTGRSLAAGVAVLGAALVALGDEFGNYDADLFVVLLAAPISFGFAVLVLTELMGPLRPLERVAPIGLGSTLGLLPLVATLPRHELVPQAGEVWLWVIAIGLFTAVGPQWLYSKSAPTVGPVRAAVAGAIELPTMFLIGYFVFDEPLTMAQGIAGLMVLVAILIVPSRQSPALLVVRRRRRLQPGKFYDT